MFLDLKRKNRTKKWHTHFPPLTFSPLFCLLIFSKLLLLLFTGPTCPTRQLSVFFLFLRYLVEVPIIGQPPRIQAHAAQHATQHSLHLQNIGHTTGLNCLSYRILYLIFPLHKCSQIIKNPPRCPFHRSARRGS